jgi:hypothetical protein
MAWQTHKSQPEPLGDDRDPGSLGGGGSHGAYATVQDEDDEWDIDYLRYTHSHRHTDRQTRTQIHTYREMERERETHTHTHKHAHTHTDTLTHTHGRTLTNTNQHTLPNTYTYIHRHVRLPRIVWGPCKDQKEKKGENTAQRIQTRREDQQTPNTRGQHARPPPGAQRAGACRGVGVR